MVDEGGTETCRLFFSAGMAMRVVARDAALQHLLTLAVANPRGSSDFVD